ncbi:hypothetical protein [uncultured Cytophaga sp.]|uniref:hypothetical protein n=1 Tax=uncultured Cytophaga sp. TaxID=160238 RepID=UPI00261E9051|nr:hypothetical protein [uncultured Cytophaga sp.]
MTFAHGQENYTVKGAFIEDSFRVGQLVHYHLRISYPKEQIAIVPDSAYTFSSFEYVAKSYFPTRTDSLFAYDSIQYILTSFNLDTIQYLQLPISFFKGKDTLKLNTLRDSVAFKRLIKSTLHKDVLGDTQIISTIQKFNYPYFIAAVLGLFLLLFILYKIFGKIIIKRYRLIILNTSHKKFIREYDILAAEFKRTADLRMIEQTLAVWKNYLTRLESKPINTFTTKELIGLYDQEELESTLQSLDRNVYGGVATKDSNDALQTIKRFTNRRFQIRRREITNG